MGEFMKQQKLLKRPLSFFIKLSFSFLATFFAITTISGCSNNYPSLDKNNPVVITLWHYYSGTQQQLFINLIDEFNDTFGEENGIIVEPISKGSINELGFAAIDAINHEVGADEIPNIFSSYADTAYIADSLGGLADISQYMTEEECSEYVDGYINEGVFSDGSLKIFPIAKSTEVLLINKTAWDEFVAATNADINDTATWEGIVRLAEQYYLYTDSLTPESNDGIAFFGRDAFANYINVGCKQLGNEIFNVGENGVEINADKDTMRRLWDNFYVPYINGWFGEYGRFRSDDMKTDMLISYVGSTSGANYFPSEVTDDFGNSTPIESLVLPLPNFEGCENNKYAVQQGAGMVVTKSTSEEEYASVCFLKWFTEKNRNIMFSIDSGYMPVKKEANNIAEIDKVIDSMELFDKIGTVYDTLCTAVKMSEDYTFYTNKPFDNGVAYRNIIESSMRDYANKILDKIEIEVSMGSDRANSAKKYIDDNYFEEWYQSFLDQLNKI